MKKGIILAFLCFNTTVLLAQNEIGPEGHKLLWVFLFLVAVVAVLFFTGRSAWAKGKKKKRRSFFSNEKITIQLEADARFYPDNLVLKIKNIGTEAIDIDRPMLVFDNFWVKRKFKIKGKDNYSFYPLFLESGNTHELNIDLYRFYSHDKSLKKFPKVKIYIKNVNGKKLGSKAVFLRKTLVKF
ncbi:hypothetical protein [uncultured Draconibacterium sp.]|uniref:hypothetical protein n=1 Tax=uncultured Draconibacterium sp. TaxID=1573823 RepID=UPI0025F37718|nr:hypothetical protein [uncultured Draconibacterium sp.]